MYYEKRNYVIEKPATKSNKKRSAFDFDLSELVNLFDEKDYCRKKFEPYTIVNKIESENKFLLRVVIPGLSKNADFDVSFTDGFTANIKITNSYNSEETKDFAQSIFEENFKYFYSLDLKKYYDCNELDLENTTAEYVNGILRIEVPYKSNTIEKPKNIKVICK